MASDDEIVAALVEWRDIGMMPPRLMSLTVGLTVTRSFWLAGEPDEALPPIWPNGIFAQL